MSLDTVFNMKYLDARSLLARSTKMKIVQIISANNKTKRVIQNRQAVGNLYKAKIGYAEAIVEENGVLKTRHMVKIPN